MSFKIITADERVAENTGTKVQIWGAFGSGKTSQLWTLDPATTLCIDLEAGMKAVQGWKGRSVSIRDWPMCKNIACWIGGPNPAVNDPNKSYSQAHYDFVVGKMGGPRPADIKTVFIDSTTNAARYCLSWASGQPEAISEKTGKPDMRGAYGLLGREIIAWAEQFQHAAGVAVVLVGGLEEKVDDFNRSSWAPMLDGSKGASAIPYIFDEVITLTELSAEDGTKYRAFVTAKDNQFGYPAKDRSGCLRAIEEPHLGRLLAKIEAGVQINLPANFVYGIPQPVAASEVPQIQE